MKICLLTDHHISVNPRVWKEAKAYVHAGYAVEILTMWTSAEKLIRDKEILRGTSIQYRAFLDLLPGKTSRVKKFFYRARKRVAHELQKRIHYTTRWAISYAPEKLFHAAREAEADLYIAHLECAFWAGRKLVQSGKKCAFDFEDWYSNDYLVPERPVKLLRQLEAYALANGFFCTFPSRSLLETIKQIYPANAPCDVVYNGFSGSESIGSAKENGSGEINLLWFSRTVGPGRGLEFLLKALEKLTIPVHLHLLGDCTEEYRKELQAAFPLSQGHQLSFHDFVAHAQLIPFISTFDMGLAIENNFPANKDKTISNKMLQYLQAGIKVLATDTSGQSEAAAYFPESTVLVDAATSAGWAEGISHLLQKPPVNRAAQAEVFNRIFSWEAQEAKLFRLISNHS